MYSKVKYLTIISALFLWSGWVIADDADDLFLNEPPAIEKVNQQISDLTQDLRTILTDKIPDALMKKAQALVVADVKKGGFLVAIQAGKGFMTVRQGDKWSDPAMVTLSSASFGFQAGVEAKTVVLVFTNRANAEQTVQGNLKLGAGLDLAVGPLATEVGTDAVFEKEVYSYSDGMGLFAGLSLQGSSLSIDPLPNQSLYNQEKVTANDIFYGKLKTTAPAANQLKMLLEDSSS
jgi:lipid-binding SYLF domain-containing protein